MKRIVLLVALLFGLSAFTSCADGGTSGGADGGHPSEAYGENTVKGKLPHIADYAERDLTYTAAVSDGARSVTLDVERTGKVTRATVTSPEGISGTEIICDAAGLRVRAPYADCRELTVSPDAAAGLAAVFGVMEVPLGREDFNGGKSFSVTVNGLTAELEISDGGFPESVLLGEARAARRVVYSDVKLSKSEKKR